MLQKRFRLLLLCSVLQLGITASASTLQYFMPDYYLGQLVRGVLKVASEVGYHQHDILQEPVAKEKAQKALMSIYNFPAFNYTYNNIEILIIRGVEGEPNGFSFGSYIFITKSMVELLSSEQLTAVIAHELAHSEKAHNLQKTPLPLEAVVYQVKTIYDSLVKGNWPKGKDLIASIQEIIGTGGLAMELQADCIAAQQLEHMGALGLPNRAADLNSATSAIFGFDITQDRSDDPSAFRARAIVNENYKHSTCDIF